MTEESKPTSLGWIVVGIAGIAFSAYLIWYGLRSRIDEEPLMIAAGVLPLSVAFMGFYAWRVAHPLAAVVIAVTIFGGVGAYAFYRHGALTTRDRANAAEREWTRMALAVCEEGRALPEAPAYTPASPGTVTPVHIIGSVYGDDRPLQWIPWRREDYPNGWFQTSLPPLVACLRNGYDVIETRSYSGGGGSAFVAARQHHYDVELVETATRREIFRGRIDGARPSPLPDSIQVGVGGPSRHRDGARVTDAAVAELLRPHIAP